MSGHKTEDESYSLINSRLVGKKTDQGTFLYKPSHGWVPDTGHEISDRLMGYDKYEPDDSPYKMFNQSIMDEIEVIPASQAMSLINETGTFQN